MALCRVLGLVASWGLIAASAHAQLSSTGQFLQRQRTFEEQLRPLISPELITTPVDQRLQYDYGLVLRSTSLWFEDHGPDSISAPFLDPDYQASRAAVDWDIRPWCAGNLDGVHFVFFRGQLDYLDYHAGDSYGLDNDWRGTYLDLGFYRLDVDEAARRYHGADVERWAADLTIGRQFLYVGRGIAYSLNTDAASLDWRAGSWSGVVFGGQWIRHFDNIDRSVPDPTRSDREFYGAELRYQNLDHHQPYAYAVAQRDHSNEPPGYDYDSEYYGLGSTGEVLYGPPGFAHGISNLRYFVEFIMERGNSSPNPWLGKSEDIKAWAADAGLVYFLERPTSPRLLIEYARASGDPDRLTPQNTLFGNAPETNDRGFLGFGYLPTGISFAPLFANLEFLRIGGALRPWAQAGSWRVKDLQIGSDLFVYWRPSSNAGVSDLRADIPGDHYLGSEWDFFVNWRLSSDLYMLGNYGLFWPHEDSFSVDKSRQFISINFTWLL